MKMFQSNNVDLSQSHDKAILYMPWREDYDIQTKRNPEKKDEACVFCTLHELEDDEGKIVYKGRHNYVMMNAQPYITNGFHVLIVPYYHTKYPHDLPDGVYEEAQDITQMLCKKLSRECYEIQSNYNIGVNANASIPNHLHQHVIMDKSARCYNLIEAIKSSQNPHVKEQYRELQLLLQQPEESVSRNSPSCDTCYYCNVLQQHNDQENLIIYRGNFVSIVFDHDPAFFGQVIIIPHHHYEHMELMPREVLLELNKLAIMFYPLWLSLVDVSDFNMGMISYGKKASCKEHIRLQLIPRTNRNDFFLSVLNKYPIRSNIQSLYIRLVDAWRKML